MYKSAKNSGKKEKNNCDMLKKKIVLHCCVNSFLESFLVSYANHALIIVRCVV